jgi:hypothetical protein
MKTWINLIVICLLAIIAAACQPAILSVPDAPTPTVTIPPTATPLPRAQELEDPTATAQPTLPAQPDAGLADQAEQAIADLIDRLSIDADQVTLVEAEAVQWRDSSLGCPQPGMMYAQVITPGYRIVLEVGGEQYAYHGAEGRPPALCAPDQKPTLQLDAALQALVEQATDDLAAHLGVKAGQIEVVAVEAVEWPDASLGCPQPGMMYAQVQQDGARILLAAGDTTYAYHSGGTRAPFLCEQDLQVPHPPPKLDGERLPPPGADDE